MPERVRLLAGEPADRSLAVALPGLKQQASRKLKLKRRNSLLAAEQDDFSVWNHDKTVEKLKYMHRNPVRRGLVTRPEDWPWSSYRHYLTGLEGTVEIESHWTAWKRESGKGPAGWQQ